MITPYGSIEAHRLKNEPGYSINALRRASILTGFVRLLFRDYLSIHIAAYSRSFG